MTTAQQLATPSAVKLGLSRVGIEVKQFFRDRQAAVFIFAFPVILMLIFGSVFGDQQIGGGISFTQYFVAGMIGSGVVYTSFQNLAIAIPQERDDGTLKRLQGTPMPKASYFMGKIGLVVMAYVGQVAALLIVGTLLFDVPIPSTWEKWATLGWLSVLGLISCTLCGIAFSSIPRNGRGAPAVVSPIVLVLQFTSGVFFVFTQLPHWMQVFASFFPLKWLTQGMRYVFLPDQAKAAEAAGQWELPRVAAMLALWCVIGLVWALVGFRWQRRGER